MKDNYDVIIVGGGTAGTYFADLLSKANKSCIVLERDEEKEVAHRLDIIHFPYKAYEAFGITPSKKGDPEYVKEFDVCYSRSALNNYEKHDHIHVVVTHLPLLIKKFRVQAKKDGAEFAFGYNVTDFMYDSKGEICGVKYLKDGKEGSLSSLLVVDASGIESNLRRKVNSPYMETFEIGPLDRFYVLLYYVDFLDPKDQVTYSTGWTYYKSWIAPQESGVGGIIGCGASTSFDYCRKCMNRFLKRIPLPQWKLDHEEAGSTPYVRQPYSFVSDHFLAVGDSAAMTNPMNGEGIAWNFVLEKKALPTVIKALDSKDLSVDSLWPINVVYQTKDGADDAFTRAAMIGAIATTDKENDFMFREGIVFKSDDEKAPDITKALLKGVFKGEMSLKTLNKIIYQSNCGSNLKKHYEAYPLTPQGYLDWKKKADKLWMKAGKMSDLDKSDSEKV